MKALFVSGVVLAVISVTVAQTNSTPNDAAKHFRWSERTAHELAYKHTIRTANDLTSTDSKALLDAVFERLKYAASTDPEMFDDVSPRHLRKLASDTRIEFVDLNGDGTPEILAQANGLEVCGGTGNCVVWAFQRTDNGFALLLDTAKQNWVRGFEVVSIRSTTTNGFRDLVLGSHGSATERTLVVYKYAKGAYRQSVCYYANWLDVKTMGRLKSPEISPCPDAQQKPCTESEYRNMETEASQLRNWNAAYNYHRHYKRCEFDADAAEGYSESVARILVDHWETLPRLRELMRRDKTFRIGLDATMDMNDITKIRQNAIQKCPTGLRDLCAKLRKSADEAIAEDAYTRKQQ
jgi:hypothetical protein